MSDVTIRTTLRLDSTLHKALRRLALDRDTTLRELVHQALRQFLDRQEEKGGQT